LIYRQTSVSLGSGPETGYVPKQKPTNPRRGRNLQRNVKHFWVLFLGIVIQFETCGGTSALIRQLACSRMTSRHLGDCITSQADLAEKYSVHSLALTAKIIEAAAMHDPDIYQSSQTFQWIRQLSDEIANPQ